MNRIFLAVACLLVATTFTACEPIRADGPMVTEQRTVSNFSGIDLHISADVQFRQAPEYKVEVRAQDEVQEVLETYVSDNKLVVKYAPNKRVWRNDGITVVVSAPELSNLRVRGSGNIVTAGPVTTNSLELDVSGSGDITLAQLTATNLDANVSGSGDLKVLAGTAVNENLRVSASGSIDVSGITAKTAYARTSGSGNTRLTATEKLDVTISGSGNVWYSGNPVVNASMSGSGKLRQQ